MPPASGCRFHVLHLIWSGFRSKVSGVLMGREVGDVAAAPHRSRIVCLATFRKRALNFENAARLVSISGCSVDESAGLHLAP